MRIGITLPQFGSDVGALRGAVTAAEQAGVDGVFVFDHLWPIGRPDGDVLHSVPLLGFVAEMTERIAVGTLVARVGVVPDAVLVNQFKTLHRMLGDRLIAGIGTGDRLSAAENRAFGLAYAPSAERVAAAGRVLRRLGDLGIVTWIGGRSEAVRRAAAADADALNVWGATAEQVAIEYGDVRSMAGSRPVGVTWGGQVLVGNDDANAAQLLDRYGHRPGLVQGSVAEVGSQLAEFHAAGCSWVVCGPLDVSAPDSAERIMAAADVARRQTEDGSGAVVH